MQEIIKKIEEEIEKWTIERDKLKQSNPYWDMLDYKICGLQRAIEICKESNNVI